MNVNVRILFFSLLLSTAKQIYAGNKTTNIIIENQEGFEALPTKLDECLESKIFEVKVDFKKGLYFFGENYLTFRDSKYSKLSLILRGNGSTIMGYGHRYKQGEPYNKSFSIKNSYISESGESIELWSDMKVVYNDVQILRRKDKKCRIYAYGESNLDSLGCVNTYICMTQWFKGAIYKVDKIKDNYIYFTAEDLYFDETQGVFNVNFDSFYYGSPYQRYKLCNVNASNKLRVNNMICLPSGIRSVYETNCTNFINDAGVALKNLVLRGFVFNGNSSDDNMALIYFYNYLNKSILIENCTFRGIKSPVIKIGYSDNITISNCYFYDCSGTCIDVDNLSNNIIIQNNYFDKTGTDIAQTSTIRCSAINYIIKNNLIRDFGGIAISTGSWWGNINTKAASGVIENNEIYLTDKFFNHPDRYSMMDVGAIYVATKNDNTVIRYNNIHDINGVKDNRGIFCDDGARGVKIYGNIITNVANCWAIDSRRVSLVESICGPTNLNNEIYCNIVDAGIRFEAREGENGCVQGVNYVLPTSTRASKYTSLSDIKGDKVLDGATAKDGILIVKNQATYRMIRHTILYKRMKRYIKKK